MKAKTPFHKTFTFYINHDYDIRIIKFSSDFDSANCAQVIQSSINEQKTAKVQKMKAAIKVDSISRLLVFQKSLRPNFVLNQLICFGSRKCAEGYKPVYKIGEQGTWQRVPEPSILEIDEHNIDLQFEFTFYNNTDTATYFSFSYPFSYEDCQKTIGQIMDQYENDKSIYVCREILTKSHEGRQIDLLTISSHDKKTKKFETYLDQNQSNDSQTKNTQAFKFKSNKPVILITARIHPGETPSSHTMNGIIKFLLDKFIQFYLIFERQDAQAYLLRKFFVFKLIPMLNPDGVYHGHYRMDIFNQNLNRFFLNPNKEKQPICYELINLAKNLSEKQRLIYFADLHAHSSNKNFFIYGNAIDDFVLQVENQLYTKVLSMNCVNFDYDDCNFSKKQMKANKVEEKDKEGSSRVQLYKQFNIIHSYTLECSFHSALSLQQLVPPQKTNVIIDKEYSYKLQELEKNDSDYYQQKQIWYRIETYENVGRALLISILDIFNQNIYSRLPNTQFQTLKQLRLEIACQLQKSDAFKFDINAAKKQPSINENIQQQFYQYFTKVNLFFVLIFL